MNAMTVGKVINIDQQRISKTFDNITVITIEIGSFEDLFCNNSSKNPYEDKMSFKEITNHFKHTMELILKFEEFSFSSAYELCN